MTPSTCFMRLALTALFVTEVRHGCHAIETCVTDSLHLYAIVCCIHDVGRLRGRKALGTRIVSAVGGLTIITCTSVVLRELHAVSER